MRRLLVALLCAVTAAAPAAVAAPATVPVVLGGLPKPSTPPSVADQATFFGQDNNGANGPLVDFTNASANPNGGLLLQNSDGTSVIGTNKACNAVGAPGAPFSPYPFGLPCSGTATTVSGSDWWQGMFFRTGKLASSNTAVQMLGWYRNGSTGVTCSSANDKCIELTGPGQSSDGRLQMKMVNGQSGNAIFFPCNTSSSIAVENVSFPRANHAYALLWGQSNKHPWIAGVDVETKTVTGVMTCSSDITTGTAFNQATLITNLVSQTLTDIGLASTASSASFGATYKYGFNGVIGPVFSVVGTFPYSTSGSGAAVPDSATLLSIASGATDLTKAVPNSGQLQAYYKLNDPGVWADSTGHYPTSVVAYTGTNAVAPTAGPPILYPAQVAISEKQSGLTFSITRSTIVQDGTGKICYTGAPVTGAAAIDGTWAKDGQGRKPTGMVVRVYNSTTQNAGTQIGVAKVAAKLDGTWSASVSGLPWGSGYTASVEWANQPKIIYRGKNTFNIGILGLTDSQSEALKGSTAPAAGQALSHDTSLVTSIMMPGNPGVGISSSQDDYARGNGVLVSLTAANAPGQQTPLYISGGNVQVNTADGLTVRAEEIAAYSGCPVTMVWTGRNGHSRTVFAMDKQAIPSSGYTGAAISGGADDGTDNGVFGLQNFATSGSDIIGNIRIGGWGAGMNTMIQPGTLKIVVPAVGGAITYTDDGATGAMTGSDGSTGVTNYGFNEVTTDNSGLFKFLGFRSSPDNGTNNFGYWDAYACPTNYAACHLSNGNQASNRGVLQGKLQIATGDQAVIGTAGTCGVNCTINTVGTLTVPTPASDLTGSVAIGSAVSGTGVPVGTFVQQNSSAPYALKSMNTFYGTINGPFTIGGANARVCVNQPNITAARSTFCTPGGARAVTVNEGTDTFGTLVTGLNATVMGKFGTWKMCATLDGACSSAAASGAASYLTFVPRTVASTDATGNWPINIVLTPGSACDSTCLGNIQVSWVTDVETEPAQTAARGDIVNVTGIPDGYGVFGDGKNCSTGMVTELLCQVRAPFTFLHEVIGAADATNLSFAPKWERALFRDKYGVAQNADPKTPVVIEIYHRNAFVGGYQGADYVAYSGSRMGMLNLAGKSGWTGGAWFYNGSPCGIYKLSTGAGPHADWTIGGSLKFNQCMSEGDRDAILDVHGTEWSVGPKVNAAGVQFTTTATPPTGDCSTPGTCILVPFTLPGSHDTAITLSGGLTAASGTGPTACVHNTVYTDGEVRAVCLSEYSEAGGSHVAFNTRANSTAYQIGDVYTYQPATCAYPFIYQVFGAGTTAASAPTGAGSSSYAACGHGGFSNVSIVDGSLSSSQVGMLQNYSNSLPLFSGQTFTSPTGCTLGTNCHVYYVIGSVVTNPIGHAVKGLALGPIATAQFTGGTGGVSSTSLTVSGTSQSVILGQPLHWTGMTGGPYVALSGPVGGGVGTYTLNTAATIANGTAISQGPYECDGFHLTKAAGAVNANFNVSMTCTIYDATNVLIHKTDGVAFGSGTTFLTYEAGDICSTVNGFDTPTDESCMGQLITGNRGFMPLKNWGVATAQGMPAIPAGLDLASQYTSGSPGSTPITAGTHP